MVSAVAVHTKALAVVVGGFDELHDLLYQIWHTLKTPSPHGLVRQFGELPFHQIEPA
jgi:hypothetical protein